MRKEHSRSFDGDVKEPVIERIFKMVERYPSRNEAAKAWGINLNTLQNYYKRRHLVPEPRENLLVKIAEHENISLEWLLHGTGEHPKEHNKRTQSVDVSGEKLFELLSILSNAEKRALFEVLARKGVETILHLLDENSIKLLQLPVDEKDRLWALHEAKKGASEDSSGDALTLPTHKAG